jgi:hypothetical protein
MSAIIGERHERCHHPLTQDWLENKWDIKLTDICGLGIDRTLVAIDCRRVRLCFILDLADDAAASIELIFNLLTAKA